MLTREEVASLKDGDRVVLASKDVIEKCAHDEKKDPKFYEHGGFFSVEIAPDGYTHFTSRQDSRMMTEKAGCEVEICRVRRSKYFPDCRVVFELADGYNEYYAGVDPEFGITFDKYDWLFTDRMIDYIVKTHDKPVPASEQEFAHFLLKGGK